MIKENLKILEDRISLKCKQVGRNREEITLIAVSKTKPNEDILEAFNAGQVIFGENKAQEMDRKSQELLKDIKWHFIGHLQTNKVKYIINSADYIHSVDSEKLAAEISKRASKINKVQKILLEIKTSEEESKMGLSDFEDILKLAEYCNNDTQLELKGLMTMAPFTDDKEVIRNCFRKLKKTQLKLADKGYNIAELSMGMSNDFDIAIEEGATMIRVGTTIFGERNYNKNQR